MVHAAHAVGFGLFGLPAEDDFAFPFGNRGTPTDPTRACTNVASARWTVRDEAKVHCRLHDLRHTYITRLLEAGNSEAIVRELIGHVDPQAMQRYTHVRRTAKREAIERAFGQGTEAHDKISPKQAKKRAKPRFHSWPKGCLVVLWIQ